MPKKLTTQEFIARARKVHGDKYDYSKVKYINTKTNVSIICHLHGEFNQTPDAHLNGEGCPLCYNERRGILHASSKEKFIEKARQIHGNKYNYSYVDYHNAHTKVEIVCPEHGSFFQTPNSHLNGRGCPTCANENMAIKYRKSTEEFVSLAESVHNKKYNYSKVVYVGNKNPVCIICPIHGDFWQSPNAHLKGHGCPSCRESRGERRVEKYLQTNNISYIKQHKTPNVSLFCNCRVLFVDFYLPDKNVIIEYNGEQHYNEKFLDMFKHKHRTFEEQQERDMALRQYCKEHKIKLIEIPYWDFDNIETILKKELKIT